MGVRSPDVPRPASPSLPVERRSPVDARARAGALAERSARPPQESRSLPDLDMRSKRPPALSFLLRMDTLRRALRVLSLLVLDLLGVSLAIFTALALKAVVLSSFDLQAAFD